MRISTTCPPEPPGGLGDRHFAEAETVRAARGTRRCRGPRGTRPGSACRRGSRRRSSARGAAPAPASAVTPSDRQREPEPHRRKKSMLVLSGISRRSRMGVPSDRDCLGPARVEPGGDDQPRQRDRGEHRAEEAERERDAEAAHRPAADRVEDDRRDQRGQVAVEDRRGRLLEAELDRPRRARARSSAPRGCARRSARWRPPPCRSVSTRPAMPGMVSVAPSSVISATRSTMFITSRTRRSPRRSRRPRP